jgi:GNAT superfamily N-acetyltransferase
VAPRRHADFSEAGVEHAPLLAEAMDLPGPEPALQSLDLGRRCFLAWVDGGLAAYGWVSFGHEHVGELERTFQFGEHDAYIWNCVTLPEYRGRRLYTALLSYMLAKLRDEGVRRVWIGTALANRPSVKGIVNAGFRPVIGVLYARLFNLHYMWVWSAPRAPEHLVAAARQVVTTDREWALGPLVVGIS